MLRRYWERKFRGYKGCFQLFFSFWGMRLTTLLQIRMLHLVLVPHHRKTGLRSEFHSNLKDPVFLWHSVVTCHFPYWVRNSEFNGCLCIPVSSGQNSRTWFETHRNCTKLQFCLILDWILRPCPGFEAHCSSVNILMYVSRVWWKLIVL